MKLIQLLSIGLLCLFIIGCFGTKEKTGSEETPPLPNILFAISDDQSFPYTSAYGTKTVKTPAFDRVANSGVLFNNAFCAAPQCSPSRAAILTGRNIWQLEEAGTHSSHFPKKFAVFTDALEAAGYDLGYTGKPWGPGNWKDNGWKRNPVGPAFNDIKYEKAPEGINNKNYTANFKAFLDQKSEDKPFFFWFGCHEPHRVYEKGAGQNAGKTLEEAVVPAFLPNEPDFQSDVLDYANEIEWFDKHLGEMMDYLAEIGELENTIIVITADNGMPFPYAKANLQEYGTHVPLAISGPRVKGPRKVDDLVSLIDLAPTFLQFADIKVTEEITGKSLLNILQTEKGGLVDASRQMVLTGRERHTHARPDNLGYPARAIRTQNYLYIWNIKPDRWPAGDPAVKVNNPTEGGKYKNMEPGYHDIDDSPSKLLILEDRKKYAEYFELGFEKRPEEQLYDILKDPACTQNLAENPKFESIKENLKEKLQANLRMQGDPRILGTGDVFESYPRIATMRKFPGFRERGEYNPKYQEKLPD